MKTLAIIGGGAAGLAAAVKAGMAARQQGVCLQVVLYESTDRVGRSILRSGNGRCNFSNSTVAPEDYYNADFVRQALWSLFCRSQVKEDVVLDFFVDWGLTWSEESEGRLYPYSGKATTVLNVLRSACAQLGVEERCESAVKTVEPPRKEGAPYTLRMVDGQFQRADAVIVACGGEVSRQMLPEDLPFVPTREVLGPLNARLALPGQQSSKKKPVNPLLGLNNIRVNCGLSVLRGGNLVAQEKGEALFRKYGISGIAVFNLSRFAQPGDTLELDLLPFVREVDLPAWLFTRRKRLATTYQQGLAWDDMLRGMLLPAVAQVVAESAGATLQQGFAKADVPQLAHALKHLALQVEGIHGEEGQCQVHRGGFDVGSFDPGTCQALGYPGLYVVGEALDIDAPCGGYNLHWAWSSGMLAALSAVEFFS